jgi:hypothetical protein
LTVRCRSAIGRNSTATPRVALQLASGGGWHPAADMNRDSHITSLDALMILKAADEAITL